jgi:hypothetical protein
MKELDFSVYVQNSECFPWLIQGSRLGVTTVISTDSIRHMMRSFVDEKQNPLLWASTYHAGEFLDPVAVAEAKAKRKAKKLAGTGTLRSKDEVSDGFTTGKSGSGAPKVSSGATEVISPKQMAVEGFKAQSEMVIDSLDRLITAWEERKESVVVEGVHLSLNFVVINSFLSDVLPTLFLLLYIAINIFS